MKNWKTTSIGIISIVAFVITLGLLILGKATISEAGLFLASVLTFTHGIGSFLTKDHDKA